MLSPWKTIPKRLSSSQTLEELLNHGTSNTAKEKKNQNLQQIWAIPQDGMENIGSSTIGLGKMVTTLTVHQTGLIDHGTLLSGVTGTSLD